MITDRANTIVVSSRMDARELAMVVLAWELELGERPKSMSWLVREIVGSMADLMHQKHREKVEVETHQDALEIIEGRGLRAHSTRSLHALTRGMQAEVLSPSVAGEPKGLEDDEMLLFAIKNMRAQGMSEEDIKERMAPLAENLAEQTRQKEADRVAAEKQAHEEMLAKFKQAKATDEQIMTEEQKFKNFTKSTITMLEDFWEDELQDKHISMNKQRYQTRWCPGATDEDYKAWLEPLLEIARPKIEARAEELRKLYEQQEREKKARRDAKAAVE